MTIARRLLGDRSASGSVESASIRSGRSVTPSRSIPDINGVEDDDDDNEQLSGLATSTKKIKSIFARKGEDLFIVLDEPHRVYCPGDKVRGKVNLTLRRPTKTLHTTIKFLGQVSVGVGKQVVRKVLFQDTIVLWGEMTADATLNLNSNSEARLEVPVLEDAESSSVYTTSAHTIDSNISAAESDRTQTSLGMGPSRTNKSAWKVGIMDVGCHVFDFEFSFPTGSMPSTVDFGRGAISYSLKCDHQKPNSLVSRGRSSCRMDISLLDNIDIGVIPIPRIRHIDPDYKSKRKEGSGKVHAYVELTKAGYLKGETIVLNIQVEHIKPIKNMRGTIVTLYRLSRFNSEEVAPQSFRKDLSQAVSPLLVDPQSLEYKISPRLRVPADVFPTIIAAGPVSFRYFVEVVLDLNARTTVWQSGSASSNGNGPSNFNIETGGEAVETDSIKREKGTHCIVFEVTIGTKDSSTRTRDRHALYAPSQASFRDLRAGPLSIRSQASRSDSDRGSYQDNIDVYDRTRLRQSSSGSPPLPSHRLGSRAYSSNQFPLSKADLELREAALLPSEPPEMGNGSEEVETATAPPLDLDIDSIPRQMQQQSIQNIRPPTPERSEILSEKEEAALRERASAPPDDGPAIEMSAPSLDQLQPDQQELPVYVRH